VRTLYIQLGIALHDVFYSQFGGDINIRHVVNQIMCTGVFEKDCEFLFNNMTLQFLFLLPSDVYFKLDGELLKR